MDIDKTRSYSTTSITSISTIGSFESLNNLDAADTANVSTNKNAFTDISNNTITTRNKRIRDQYYNDVNDFHNNLPDIKSFLSYMSIKPSPLKDKQY
mgnify:FL=1